MRWKNAIIDRGDTENSEAVQFLNMAIEALEQEPCDDCISRKEIIRWVKTECNPYGKPTLDFESGKRVIEHLEQMPSAEPKRGKWLDDNNSFNSFYANCSECGYQMDKHAERGYHNYCPYCGARMRSGEE